jgi:hypothetical protein
VVIHAILQTRHELHLLPSKTKESLGGPAPRTTESFKGMNDQGRAQLAGILPNPWKARKSRAEVQRFDNFGGTQAFKDSKRYLKILALLTLDVLHTLQSSMLHSFHYR